MKRLIFAAAAASTLMLTACGGPSVSEQLAQSQASASSASETATSVPSETASPTTPVDTDPDITQEQQVAIEYLVDNYPVFEGVPQSLIVEGFEATCGLIDSGNSIEYIASTMLDVGYEPEEAGALIAYSVVSTCPEYVSLVQQFVDDYGN